jgi:hypothetical protein
LCLDPDLTCLDANPYEAIADCVREAKRGQLSKKRTNFQLKFYVPELMSREERKQVLERVKLCFNIGFSHFDLDIERLAAKGRGLSLRLFPGPRCRQPCAGWAIPKCGTNAVIITIN